MNFEDYATNSGVYRKVSDFSRPWVASPINYSKELHSTSGHAAPQRTHDTIETRLHDLQFGYPRAGIRLRPRFGVQRLMDSLRAQIRTKKLQWKERKAKEAYTDTVPLSDWKAFGYYACPNVHGCHVTNISARKRPTNTEKLEQLATRLFSPDPDSYRQNPAAWVPGQIHPALPPRPARWPRPKPGRPLAFPWECQLNPFLVHKVVGPSPLNWDVTFPPSTDLYLNVDNDDVSYPLMLPDFNQPATYPFLTHMYINAVAEDPAKSAWPILVKNSEGIRVYDVFMGVYDSLRQYVFEQEYDSWPLPRREHALRSYYARESKERQIEGRFEQGIQRVDYYGYRIFFRGLEPSPERDGWVLFLGFSPR